MDKTGLNKREVIKKQLVITFIVLAALMGVFLLNSTIGKAANDSTVTLAPECIGCHNVADEVRNQAPIPVNCAEGKCHPTLTSTQKSGSHVTHFPFSDTGAERSKKGPALTSCDTCHGTNASQGQHVGHINGVVNFNNNAQETLLKTAVCNNCHSPSGGHNGVKSENGSVGAKNNWKTGVYQTELSLQSGKEKWCVGCHDEVGAVIDGVTAPSVGGNGSSYGFFINGHGLASGKYDYDLGDANGNNAASKQCQDCHDLSIQHLDGVDSTETSTNISALRLKSNINGQSVNVVNDVCKACHGNAGSALKVSQHGNDQGGGNTQHTEENFVIQCIQCHEVHGNNKNSEGNRNIKMIRRNIKIKLTPETTGDVVFTAHLGQNSFDESDVVDTDDNDDICATCHRDAYWPTPMNSTPGSHVGGLHQGVDNRGVIECTNCHTHDYKGDGIVQYDDGFMPSGSCGGCHPASYEGVNGDRTKVIRSGAHATHLAPDVSYDPNDPRNKRGPKILTCDVCHGVGANQGQHAGHGWQAGRSAINYAYVNFAESLDTTLGPTGVCNNCHSPGGGYNGVNSQNGSIGAKDNWFENGNESPSTLNADVYADTSTLKAGKEKWCVGCHDSQPSKFEAWDDSTNTTAFVTAPQVGGDSTNYGFYTSGHGVSTTTQYDETSVGAGGGNYGAGKECTTCHSLNSSVTPTSLHISLKNDTDLTGQRIKNVINTVNVNSITEVCKACHTTTAGQPASVQVSTHGNTETGGYSKIETDTFSVNCNQCHELHGNNKNTQSIRNLKMIASTVTINATSSVTTQVVFTKRTGANSFDDSLTLYDNVCRVCHESTSNPGYPMARHTGGLHDPGMSGSDKDKKDRDCTICHRHDYKNDGTVTYDDGFMPAYVSGTCGTENCHDYLPSTQKSGSHTTHFSTTDTNEPNKSNKGPALTVCARCHGTGADSGDHVGHFNGQVNFAGGANDTLTVTTVCSSCHSPSGSFNGVNDTTIGAKNNWITGVYTGSSSDTLQSGKENWCLGCHDNAPSQINAPATNNTTMTAPDIGGDNSSYGFRVSGHGKTSGQYDKDTVGDAAGNPAANKQCTNCHDLTKQHLSSQDDTTFNGQRLADTVDGTSVTTAQAVCKACHSRSSGSATVKVSSHGNTTQTGYYDPKGAFGSPIESDTPAFSVKCLQCHEPHGNNLNVNNNRNLKMVKRAVVISETTGTTGDVVFTSTTATDSFDESDAVDNDDICATCHSNANNPGYPMKRHVGGNHAVAGGEGQDRRGQQCTSCHKHNYQDDSTLAYDDGFMPTGCDGCHGYPPWAGQTSGKNREAFAGVSGGAHKRHYNELSFACSKCHGHNGSGPEHGGDVGRSTVQRQYVSFNFTADPQSFPGGTSSSASGNSTITPYPGNDTTPRRCNVGCHNPIPFKPNTDTVDVTNDATWTETGPLGCNRCHESQPKALLKQTVNGMVTTSTHSFTGVTDYRAACTKCHEIADTNHKSGQVRVVIRWDSSTEATDWNPTGNKTGAYKFCLGCHDSVKAADNDKFTSNNNTAPDIKQYWESTETSDIAHRDSTRQGGASKQTCFGDGTVGTGCHATPHGSAKRNMLAAADISPGTTTNTWGGDEEKVCLGCHNTTVMPNTAEGRLASVMEYKYVPEMGFTANFTNGSANVTLNGGNWDPAIVGMWIRNASDGDGSGSDSAYRYYKIVSVSGNTLTMINTYAGTTQNNATFYVRAKRAQHPIGTKQFAHTKDSQEGTQSGWNPDTNRHAECQDCHNPHRAGSKIARKGYGDVSGDIGEVNKGVWGLDTTYTLFYNTGTAVFKNGSTSVSGSGTSWQPGWTSSATGTVYIKNNYDQNGRWYRVTAISGGTALTITPAYDGARTPTGALGNAVDYTMVKIQYTRIANPTKQYQLCLKCHSSYAYTDTPPYTPSGMSNASTSTLLSVRETEVGLDFSPDQLAYHPVIARGKNQPAPTLNAKWPKYITGSVNVTNGSNIVTGSATNWLNMGGSGTSTIIPGWYFGVGAAPTTWYIIKKVDSNTQITLETTYTGPTASGQSYVISAGLGNTFVPPYGPWSIVVCSDCHEDYWASGTAGPHGNEKKWQLKESTAGLTFNWWTGTVASPNNSVISISPNNETIGTGIYTPEVFCYNCHRRDVYGDVNMGGANADNSNETPGFVDALLSRISHDPSADSDTYKSTRINKWGIVCMNCHAGDSLGGAHGTGAGVPRVDVSGNYVPGGISGTRPRGERFLNGASWVASVKPTTTKAVACWTKGTYSNDAVNNCTKGHANKVADKFANYNY